MKAATHKDVGVRTKENRDNKKDDAASKEDMSEATAEYKGSPTAVNLTESSLGEHWFTVSG